MKRIGTILTVFSLLLALCVPCFATTDPEIPEIRTRTGASVRLNEPSGLRFESEVNRTEYDALTEAYGAENVRVGTLIAPESYVLEAGAFTKEALDALDKKSVKYLDVVAGAPYLTLETSYVFAGSVANILPENRNLAFAAIGYIEVLQDGEWSVRYSPVYTVRSVSRVATAAYADVRAEADGEYLYEINGVFSPYSEEQRSVLEALRDPLVYEISTVEDWKTFTSLVNNRLDRFSGKTVRLTADLDFSEETSYVPVGYNPGYGDTSVADWGGSFLLPSDSNASYFAGTLDGQGHCITGLNVAFDERYSGLFGLTWNASIRNLHLDADFTNTAGGWYHALLIAYAVDTGVDNCRISGSYMASGAQLAAGVVGTAFGCVEITNTICDADLSGLGDGYYCAGFVGYGFGASNNTRIYIGNSYLLTSKLTGSYAMIAGGGADKVLVNSFAVFTDEAYAPAGMINEGNCLQMGDTAIVAESALAGKTDALGGAYVPGENGLPALRVESGAISVRNIGSVEDWNAFAREVNEGNTFAGTIVRLVSDLDFSDAEEFVSAGSNPTLGDNDVVAWDNTYHLDNARYFAGTFDGQGHSITGLTFDFQTGYTGLFGMTCGAEIRNLRLVADFTNSSGKWHNGILVGLAINTRIRSCHIGGSYRSSTAGLIGGTVGTAAQMVFLSDVICEVDCSELGAQYSGGMVGYAFGANNFTCVIIDRSYLRTPAVSNTSGSAINILIGDGGGSKLLNHCYAVLTGECALTSLTNGSDVRENDAKLISDDELKGMVPSLGAQFKIGENGYPVLQWES